MKILAIRGKNLASLEGTFELDFTVEPLRSAGIFAITGSTGSGKSTLLDALCLALFDDTPRTSRASENNIQIADVKDKTINQRDSRNILRRGTSDGFAEVDFISLGGEKYRSRWSVRRSRDKADGALQGTELRLTNLTAGLEEQGRKTELLAKIVELTGLSFDQFTRAVMLAQGDFATFLKATQKEKAELLEKLTGTEIYSRISKTVFERSKNAEQELQVIRERIKDIELLTDEELEALTAEKLTITENIEAVKKEIDILTVKIKWITDESALHGAVANAEQAVARTAEAIDGAKPRYDYLTEVDNVQAIRDRFNEMKTVEQQLAEAKNNLAGQERLRAGNALLAEQWAEKVALCEENLLRHNEEFEIVKPEIQQARELDIQIEGAAANKQEAGREYKQVQDRKSKIEKSIAEIRRSVDEAQTTIVHVEAWFNESSLYRDVIPRVDLIVNLLDDAAAANKQKANNAATLADCTALGNSATAQLAVLTEEAERLNRLLPAEIAVLRAKLEVGKPCPVCGSDHHPFAGMGGESLEETRLNNAKKETAEKISKLTGKIEDIKNEKIRLASAIDSYSGQYSEAMARLESFLATVSDWKVQFEHGSLQDSLRRIAEIWKKNESIRSAAYEKTVVMQASLRHAEEQLAEAGEAFAVREKKVAESTAVLTRLRITRNELFGGQAAAEVEKLYVQRGKDLADALSSMKEEVNKVLAENEKLKGTIGQISAEMAKLTERGETLRKAVDEWVAGANVSITRERMEELLLKDNVWIMAEREWLARLERDRAAASATRDERRQTLERHYSRDDRPAGDETREMLEEMLVVARETLNERTRRNTEIDIKFAGHNKGKERMVLFERELNEKSVLSENWKKLNDLFGSADGAKFKVLAQGYTLDALLVYANKHLQGLSDRYEIQRIPDTLALQVADMDMLGGVRTVHSLSGGESFLVSLALALGLSSLSSGKMKIESLFIDEGFGSLDAHTLRTAMDALERLQTQGRKIGVISHVAEMTERISAQIQVVKTVNGRSRIEIREL